MQSKVERHQSQNEWEFNQLDTAQNEGEVWINSIYSAIRGSFTRSTGCYLEKVQFNC